MQSDLQAPVAPMDYLRPDRIEDALAALEAGRRTVVAGCTDVLPATEAHVLAGSILDVTGIRELRGITRSGEGWEIGATTTWADIARAELPPAFRALQLAAREVGARQIQNRATIAGNLCNASPAADGVPPLLVLDATVELRSTAGSRSLALADFLTGPRSTVRRPEELVTAIRIPDASARGESAFLKLGAREYLVISIAMCAVRLELSEGRISAAAIAVGACGPVATRLPQAETALIGSLPDPALVSNAAVTAALSPIDDVRADAAYRSRAAAELVRRTLAGVRLAAPA